MATMDIIEALKTEVLNTQLEGVKNLKKLFSPPDRIFSKIKLQPLFQSARVSLENDTTDMVFLLKYGFSLLDFIGKNPNLNSEIIHQVKLILEKTQDEKLIEGLWNHIEKNTIDHPNEVWDASKPVIEKTVLEWVDDTPNNRMEFLSRMSADSPKLFQTITSILYEVLVKTRGHVKVFEVTSKFVEGVKLECQKKEKSYLGLYPKGCRRLVSLMRCPPELCSDGKEDFAKEVVSLLLDTFLSDRRKALILLSHFTKWVCVFKNYLESRDI